MTNTAIMHHSIERLLPLVGNTPLFPITKAYQKKGVQIYAKLEWQQIGGSIKSRPAFNIIRHALLDGHLHDKTLLDATSGNTGIAYATIAKELGVKVKLVLPENASKERKTLLKSLGVELVLSSRFEGTDGAQQVAATLAAEHPDHYYLANQYANVHNWQAHYEGTAPEIIRQTKGKITHFVAGLGTTGTFVGTGRRLREYNDLIRLVSLQPDNPMHGLEGWKHLETAIVPQIYDPFVADNNLEVATMEAYEWVKRLKEKEGLFVSPSAAANLLGAVKVAESIDEGVIVTTFADDASKYSEVIDFIFK